MKPPVLLTGGDPCGIGPEIIERALHELLTADFPPLLYFATGGAPHCERLLEMAAHRHISAGLLTESPVAPVQGLVVVDLAGSGTEKPGEPGLRGGVLAFRALELAADYAGQKPARALVTAPLSKQWVERGAGCEFRGHTDYLAARAACPVLMLMHGHALSVVPLTVHIPLAEVPGRLREAVADPNLPGLLERVAELPEMSSRSQDRPWALCGLNPHSGEGGHMGREELNYLEGWADTLRARGLRLDGPLSADGLFSPGVRSRYRLILSCYHDQGLIPFKALEAERGINVTIGLPYLRTSPDHGTAFEIAGRGIASATSMIQALSYAARAGLVEN
ncbi:MAG: 4-hydroxythreonine-4-phosphate dehydrogenase PdxA [Spirochaetales bacterium]|nr:4-hydroxythreonine-4-phosphate dehydrogenase PdxA [Leptospiraceae bacterium]MCP5480449.1 4-hydroxythreonine-4-phosphate dehydrogenase PdxA [Spirochaetales bacterium]